jgi:guanosine-3',5'-bis(diphosphate) 3'-pyrophosphohydrolase
VPDTRFDGTPETAGVLLTAMLFSANKHRDQRRKDAAQSPYINHPIEVAELLWRVGGVHDVQIILAALLHDTLEDTQTTPEEIESRFGASVLELVQEVSDDKSLSRDERKRLQIVNAANKSVGAKLIKLADKCCNVRDLVGSPPKKWSVERRREYLHWTAQVVAGLRGTNAALEAYYDQELTSGTMLLGDG